MQKISRELAKAINERAEWLFWNEYGMSEEKWDQIYKQVLGEFTAQPGDHDFCWPGEGKRCYHYQGESMMHVWPEAWEGPMKCTHPDAKPGKCPLQLHGCGGRLMPASFMVEDSQAPDGYRDAQGFRCEECGEEVITAQEARRIEQLDASDKIGRGE